MRVFLDEIAHPQTGEGGRSFACAVLIFVRKVFLLTIYFSDFQDSDYQASDYQQVSAWFSGPVEACCQSFRLIFLYWDYFVL